MTHLYDENSDYAYAQTKWVAWDSSPSLNKMPNYSDRRPGRTVLYWEILAREGILLHCLHHACCCQGPNSWRVLWFQWVPVSVAKATSHRGSEIHVTWSSCLQPDVWSGWEQSSKDSGNCCDSKNASEIGRKTLCGRQSYIMSFVCCKAWQLGILSLHQVIYCS